MRQTTDDYYCGRKMITLTYYEQSYKINKE